jgi:hypothetical protein
MKTEIAFVLDSSGSMSAIENDTIGGFNAFLTDQQDGPGTARVTLYEFNTTVNRVYQARPVMEAPKLSDESYTPGGSTALHDAIYTAITETSDRFGAIEPTERPDNVVVVVLTDGKENASETPQARVREQVQYRREQKDWKFLFIGANQDAALTAGDIGINQDRSLTMAHSGDGTKAAYDSTSKQVNDLRETGNVDGYDTEDRQRQKDARNS